MNINKWWVERLDTTNREYERLKAAGLDTIGEVKEAMRDGARSFAEKVGVEVETAQKLAKQISELEGNPEPQPVAEPEPELEESELAAPAGASFGSPARCALQDPCTLDELKSCQEDTITPETAAKILGCDAQGICSQARIDAGALGFPVIVLCGEVKIPRRGFIYFMEYGRASGGGKN